jgi:hypothetical protein
MISTETTVAEISLNLSAFNRKADADLANKFIGRVGALGQEAAI